VPVDSGGSSVGFGSVFDRLNWDQKKMVNALAPSLVFCFAALGMTAGGRVDVVAVDELGRLDAVDPVGVGDAVMLERAASFSASQADRLAASPATATAASVRRIAVPP
jgi:hypothetical protein